VAPLCVEHSSKRKLTVAEFGTEEKAGFESRAPTREYPENCEVNRRGDWGCGCCCACAGLANGE